MLISQTGGAKDLTAHADASVTVIVVTFGQAAVVRECLSAVFASVDQVRELRVVVVDNQSPDGTVAMIEREFPAARIIRSATNDGFAVANNRALRDMTTDYALLLNPDCILHDGALVRAIDGIKVSDTVGMLGCRLVTREGQFDHASKRMIPDPVSALRYFIGARGSQYLAPDVGEFEDGEVEAINGAFMLVDARAIREVGLLDERYWMYAEDLDWCLRFTRAGWKVLYLGSVTCTHLKSAISGRARSPRLNWHFHRSMSIFFWRNSSDRNLPVRVLVVAAIYGRLAFRLPLDSSRRAYARLIKDAPPWRGPR